MDELERFEPELGGQIAYEQLHRYAIAKNYVANLRVLDLACGEGYGTALLAEAAAHVTGVDINAAAVSRAQTRYTTSDRLYFKVGDGEALPLKSGSMDVIVSFRTSEHVPDPHKLLVEIKRVLKKGGLLILSLPTGQFIINCAANPMSLTLATWTSTSECRRCANVSARSN
jgi:ubiquinone/menaquinone biosynthesis C-methylase UbiE